MMLRGGLRLSALRRAKGQGRIVDAQEERRQLLKQLHDSLNPKAAEPELRRRARAAIDAYEAGSTPQHPLVVNLWCNSRLGGTDLFYAFAQRSNTVANDEPLCRHFLELFEETPPEMAEIRKHQPLDFVEAVGETIYGPFTPETKLVVNKSMAKHLSVELPDYGFLADPHVRNVIVLQRPADVVRSWLLSPAEFLDLRRSNTHASANFKPPRLQDTIEEDDLSYADQYCMVHDLKLDRHRPLIVVEHRELLRRPRTVLKALCAELDLEWDERMLAWPRGGIQGLDGPWAKRYNALLHSHTGFTPEYAAMIDEFLGQPIPAEFDELIEECQSVFEFFEPHLLQIPADDTSSKQ